MRPRSLGHILLLVSLIAPLCGVLLYAGSGPRLDVTITGGPGTYSLRINGAPFYVRGVSLGIGDQQERAVPPVPRPLLRAQLRRIRDLGANTIRLYASTPSTPMILDEASRAGLMVLMGYWLDQDVDYLNDTARLGLYRARIRQWVLRYRAHPAVLMWVLGNETWGLLKAEFPNPRELTAERAAYDRFLEDTAKMVKALDPHRPVMTVEEHVPDLNPSWIDPLPRALDMFRALVPSVDIFGVNSYFAEDLAALQATVVRSHIDRPYMVTEFGPPGYWLPRRMLDDIGQPKEPTDPEKAAAYADNWSRSVAAYRGWNLGGNAFAWRDRPEGSFTWFGLTDSLGRFKPAYWTLRRAWTGKPAPADRPLVVEFAINKRWMRAGESFVVRTRLAPGLDPDRYEYTYLVAPTTMAYIETQLTTDLPVISLHAPDVLGTFRVYVYAVARDEPRVSTGSATFGVYEPKTDAFPALP